MKKVCQSCGMPIENDDQLGLNKDGTKSTYCSFCYENGQFLQPDITVEEMRTFCINIMKEKMNVPKFLGKMMTRNIYKLERWN